MKRIVSVALIVVAFTTIASKVQAQNFGATPKDSIDCIMNNSLYIEFYNQKNYKDAYEPWKACIKSCPKQSENLYIRGKNILLNLMAKATTAADQQKYFNELMALYDTRTTAFGDTANNLARKAQDIAQYQPTQKQKAFETYKKAVEIGGEKGENLNDEYKPLYLKACYEYLSSIKAKEAEMGPLFDAYDYAAEALDYSLSQAKANNDNKGAAKIQSYIGMIDATFEPFASCDKIIPMYQEKYDKTPNDIALLKKITTVLEKKGCTSSQLFFSATESLHKLEPTPKSAMLMGQMLAAKKQYREASSYLKEATEKGTDNDFKGKAYFLYAQTLMQLNEYSAARSAFYQVSHYDRSKEGECYYMIASMYLSSAASCASHEGKIRGAAWAAYDKAAKAKALDPSISGKCQNLMNRCVGQWPSKESAFFYQISNGQSYTVGCWIGESTTVRLR